MASSARDQSVAADYFGPAKTQLPEEPADVYHVVAANMSQGSLNEGVELIEIVGEGVVLQLPNHGVWQLWCSRPPQAPGVLPDHVTHPIA